VEPVDDWNEPASQLVQKLAPTDEYVPAEHAVDSADDAAQ
jgi:hypothetical protein